MTSLLQFVNLFRVSPEEVTLSLSVSDFSFVGDYCLANFGEAWRDEFLYVHRKKYYETAAIFPSQFVQSISRQKLHSRVTFSGFSYRLRLRRVDTRKLTFNRISFPLDDVAPTNSIDPTSPPVAIDTSQLSRPRRRQQAFVDRFVISLLMHHHSLKYSP